MKTSKKKRLFYSLGVSSLVLVGLMLVPFIFPLVVLLPLVIIIACTGAQLLTYYLYTLPKERKESELKIKQAELLEEAKGELDRVLDQAVELRRGRYDGGREDTEETDKSKF